MPWGTILRYSLSAAIVGLCCGGAWLAARLGVMRKRIDRREALYCVMAEYLGAVVQIIGLRLGLVPVRLLRARLSLIPLATTLNEWRQGPGALVYHVFGNLLWFVPLGALLRILKPRACWHQALLAGAVLSVFVEALQALLGTGNADIDDVVLNALGALAGWGCAKGRR